jgi:HEAT repeat protein
LLDYLAIKDIRLISLASDILREMGPVAAQPLRKILGERSLDRSRTGILLSVLGDIKDEESFTTFLSFFENDDPHLRSMSLRGLIALKYPDLSDILLPSTQDESRSVRKYSALALKGYDDPAAIKSLFDLLGDEHFSVRFAAFEGLQQKEDTAKPYLIEGISKKICYPVYAFDLMEDLLEKWDEKVN